MLRNLISGASLLLALSVFGCTDDTGSDDETGVMGDAARGEMLYGQTCVTCHGADGKGGIDINGTLSADLTFEVTDLSDEEFADVIANGVGAAMPPQYQDEQDIADVIAYLRATFG